MIAFDRVVPTELWRLDAEAVSPTLWNDDWDGSGLVAGGHLFEGGENSQFHAVRLNRSYGADGKVEVAPVLAFHAPGWDDELLAGLDDFDVSIEGSVALAGGVAWFANSGGLVQGWDVSGLLEGTGEVPERVFRFWMGDDVDATVVVDDEGMLYVAAEWERHTARSRVVGQVVKLDPSRPANPVVWSVADHTGDAGRRVGHARPVARPGDRRHQRRPATGHRPRHRPGAVDEDSSPARYGSRPWSSTASSSRVTATASSTATTCPTPRSTPPSSGPSNSPAASSPPPPSGTEPSTSAPGKATSTPSAKPSGGALQPPRL